MTAPSPQDGLRVCVFSLAQERFGVRLESVREIVSMAALSRPPSMPSILEGFLNFGGTAIPVLKIAGLLGLPQELLELHTTLVITRGGQLPLALIVNRVMGIVSVPVGSLMPISEADSFNGCVAGSLMAEGQVVHLLSVDRLLLEKEQRVVAEFQETETRRLRDIDGVPS